MFAAKYNYTVVNATIKIQKFCIGNNEQNVETQGKTITVVPS